MVVEVEVARHKLEWSCRVLIGKCWSVSYSLVYIVFVFLLKESEGQVASPSAINGQMEKDLCQAPKLSAPHASDLKRYSQMFRVQKTE